MSKTAYYIYAVIQEKWSVRQFAKHVREWIYFAKRNEFWSPKDGM